MISATTSRVSSWAGWFLLALALALPFDSIRPLFSVTLAGVAVEFSLLELAVLPFVFLSLPAVWGEFHARIERERGRFLFAVFLLWLVCALLSSAFADDVRVEAFRFLSRLALFSLLYWSVRAWLVRTRSSGSTLLLRALILGSIVSGLIGFLDWVAPDVTSPALSFFRFGPSHAAGIQRVSATFPYATIAAIHFEMLVPLGLVVLLRERSLIWRVAGGLVTGLSLFVTVFSWTRTGMVALALVLPAALVSAAVIPKLGRWTRPLFLSIVGLCASVGGLILATQDAELRLRTESDLHWAKASYRVPEAITGPASGRVETEILVRNTGERAWEPTGDPITRLQGRWLSSDEEWLLDDGDLGVLPLDFALPARVEPGDTARVAVKFDLPAVPGRYVVSWGLVLDGLYAFRHRGVPEETSPVTVRESSAAGRPPIRSRAIGRTPTSLDQPAHAWNVPRRDLWYAALEFFRQRPVLGIGPGTFRFRYGEPLGLERVDQRVHPNNQYLQFLAEQGAVGLILFLLLIAGIAAESRFLADSVRFGAGVAVAIFLVHSLADGFLSFVSSYSLFAICLGLLSAGKDRSGSADRDR